jgi:hypothetical protein
MFKLTPIVSLIVTAVVSAAASELANQLAKLVQAKMTETKK